MRILQSLICLGLLCCSLAAAPFDSTNAVINGNFTISNGTLYVKGGLTVTVGPVSYQVPLNVTGAVMYARSGFDASGNTYLRGTTFLSGSKYISGYTVFQTPFSAASAQITTLTSSYIHASYHYLPNPVGGGGSTNYLTTVSTNLFFVTGYQGPVTNYYKVSLTPYP